MIKIEKRIGIDMEDKLKSEREMMEKLLKSMVSVNENEEENKKKKLIKRSKRREKEGSSIEKIGMNGRIDRKKRVIVIDEIEKVWIIIIEERSLEGDRLIGDFKKIEKFLERNGKILRKLLRSRLKEDLMKNMERSKKDIVDSLDNMKRNEDSEGMIGNRKGNWMKNKKGRIGREIVEEEILKIIERFNEENIELMNEIEEMKEEVSVIIGNRNKKEKVRLKNLIIGDGRLELEIMEMIEDKEELKDGNRGLGWEIMDLDKKKENGIGLIGGKLIKEKDWKGRKEIKKVRVKIMEMILIKEVLKKKEEGLGKKKKIELVMKKEIIDIVKMIKKMIDKVMVERKRIKRIDKMVFKIIVEEIMDGGKIESWRKEEIEMMVMKIEKIIIGIGDEIESLNEMREKLGLNGRKRKVGLIIIVVIVLKRNIEEEIGNVVVVKREEMWNLIERILLLKELDKRRMIGLGEGIGGLEIDDLEKKNIGLVEMVEKDDDRMEDKRDLKKKGDNGLEKGIDEIWNGDLELERKKIERKNLEKINEKRIVSEVGRIFIGSGGGKRSEEGLEKIEELLRIVVVELLEIVIMIVILKEIDENIGKNRNGVLDMIGSKLIGRKKGIKIVNGEVEEIIRKIDNIIERIVRKVEKRKVGRKLEIELGLLVLIKISWNMFL